MEKRARVDDGEHFGVGEADHAQIVAG